MINVPTNRIQSSSACIYNFHATPTFTVHWCYFDAGSFYTETLARYNLMYGIFLQYNLNVLVLGELLLYNQFKPKVGREYNLTLDLLCVI